MKIAVFEPNPSEKYPSPVSHLFRQDNNDNHGERVIDTIKYWVNHYAPELNNKLDIVLLPNIATGFNWAKNNDCLIANMSVADWFFTQSTLKYEIELAKTCLLVTSAGNGGSSGETGAAQRERWLAVGAVDGNHTLRSYSSWKYGKVTCCGIDGINGNTGTSFSSPYVVALTFIYYEYHKDAMGYYPSPKQALQWVKFNAHDVFTDGWDLQTGYGVLRLPRRWEFTDVAIQIDDVNTITKRNYVDGIMKEKIIDLAIPSHLQNSRLFLSVREMGQAVDGTVHYDTPTRTAYIGG